MTSRARRKRRAIWKAIREPDPWAVAKVADSLNMDPTKVAAVWMLMVDETVALDTERLTKPKDPT